LYQEGVRVESWMYLFYLRIFSVPFLSYHLLACQLVAWRTGATWGWEGVHENSKMVCLNMIVDFVPWALSLAYDKQRMKKQAR